MVKSTEMENEDRKVFICECNSLEHQLIFWYDESEGELYCEPHLTTHKGFFKRLFSGLRYAFGYKSRFGNWDSTILKNSDLKYLRDFLNSNIKQD
jgi:hypothetical protein